MRNTEAKVGFGCYLLVLALNLLIGGFATSYCVEHWFHKQISFLICCICGLFLGQFLVPAAIVTWILVLTGVIG